ncbi:MAG: prolipoprotein diacylglyceryl transferase [Planctomycetales bacterium]|nr:prolipoprotein diacylglyceryl transferase [Planctomycetales bacterium]
MRSTLFLIPHDVAGIPLFGVGILLACLVILGIAWFAWSLARKHPLSDLLATLPVWLVAAAVVTFVLPNVEQRLADGTPLGLPIRGYGVMVLLGLLAGIGITIHRGQQLRIAADTIIGLGFWMMLGGIVGARLFYVVQKWNTYDHLGLTGTVVEFFKLTEGGLVIYGGVVGGLLAGAAFCFRHRLKIAATADLIAPGFLIGLSIGRIGCLLHGCCFGGVCEANLPAIQFPKGSGPYQSQVASGRLLGIELREQHAPPAVIAQVDPDSVAAQSPIAAGEVLENIALGYTAELDPSKPNASPPFRAELTVSGKRLNIRSEQLPDWSLPVHPSQIYASINALLLCLLIWQLQPLPSRDGVVFLIAILLYAVSRFLLEGVRSDEAGQLGTAFSIAQLVSMGSGVAAILGLAILSRLPPGRAWNWQARGEAHSH